MPRETRIVAGLLAAMVVAGALIWWAMRDDGGVTSLADVEAGAEEVTPDEPRSGQAPVVRREDETAEIPPSEGAHVADLALPRLLPGLKLPPAQQDFGKLDTAGELSKTEGAKAVAAFYPFAIRCLLETRQKEPHVGARITLRLRVVPDGPGRTRVLDLDALDKGKTSATLRACLRKSLSDVPLDLGPEARGTVSAPMVLGPDNDPAPAPLDPAQQAGAPQDLHPGEGPDSPDNAAGQPVPPPDSPPPPGEFDDADEPQQAGVPGAQGAEGGH